MTSTEPPAQPVPSSRLSHNEQSESRAVPLPELPLETVTNIAIHFLAFDAENPRFTPDKGLTNAKPCDIVDELIKTADLKELIESIAANGYINIEPLIVMRNEGDAFYSVLEGNRRLAALRVLTDSALAAEVGIQVPGFTQEAEKSFRSVAVYRVADRARARAYIGFKHINGPQSWDSLAKGRFAAEWFKRESPNGTTLRDIARKLGDGHATVKRLVQGIYVLDQARDAGIFTVEDRYPGKPFGFSHLYTALTRPGYRKFLNLPPDWQANDPTPNPVPPDAYENLKRLMVWLYGSAVDRCPPAIKSQNPDIKNLGEVLEHPIARKEMLTSSNLSVAYGEIQTESFQLEQSIIRSYRHAEEAQAKLSSFEGDDAALVEVANRLRKSALFIHSTMDTRRQKWLEENPTGTSPPEKSGRS